MIVYFKGMVLHFEQILDGLGHEQRNGIICGQLEFPLLLLLTQHFLEYPPPHVCWFFEERNNRNFREEEMGEEIVGEILRKLSMENVMVAKFSAP